MSNTFIQEAFQNAYLVEDAEEFSLNVSGPDDVESFLDIIDGTEDEVISDIYDLEAEAKEELKQSYIGKVILDCNVCHSNVFFDRDQITEDEDGLCCIDIECPYCMSNEGYTIIGEVKPFAEEGSEEEPEDDVDLDVGLEDNEEVEEPIEIESEEDEDDDLDESLTEAFLEGQNVYIKPDKRFGKIKSHIKDDLYEVETYDGEDKNLPDRVDTYYASDLELNESLLSGDESLNESWIEQAWSEMTPEDEENLKYFNISWKEIGRDGQDILYRFEGSEEDFERAISEGGYFYGPNLVIHDDSHGESVKNGYIKESISEETDITTVKVDAWADGHQDEEEFKSWLTSHYPSLSCKFTGDKYENLILTGPKQDIKKYLLNDYSYEDEGEDWVDTQYPQLKESIENVSIDTDDETMTMTTKEDGGVVVETSPIPEVAVEDEVIDDAEMIAPLEPETEAEIEEVVDEVPMEDEEMIPEDEMIIEEPGEDEFEEFDEESFDQLGESYLKRCYENVTSFKTSNITINESKEFIIEGKIGFDSGNEKDTQFIFTSKNNENGKLKLEGYNKQISTGKKTFKLNCSVNDKALVCESLNYNYKSKNDLNESVRVYGTVKRK